MRCPPRWQRLIAERERRGYPSHKFLHRCIDLLCQLHLLEPVLPGKKPSTQTSSAPSRLHEEYSLVPALSVLSYHFAFPASVTQYWAYLHETVTAPVEAFDLPTLTREWRVSPVLWSHLRHPHWWRYRLYLSKAEMAQLKDLDAAVAQSSESPTAMMSLGQIVRAANLAGTSASAAATLFARIHFPPLAATHDRLGAFEQKMRRVIKVQRQTKEEDEEEEEVGEEEEEKAPKKKRRTRKEEEGGGGESREGEGREGGEGPSADGAHH